MSENLRDTETCIVISDKFTSAVLNVWWDLWLLFYYKFTADISLKEFLKPVDIFCKVIGKKVDCPRRPVHPRTVLLTPSESFYFALR